MHYNVQSIFPKLEVIHTELFDFDILTFSLTWLSDTIDTDDLLLESFNKPERKNRPGDSHGGVMLYVKELINELSQYCVPSLNVILYGDLTLSLETNLRIFQAVHKCICNTQRF